LKITTTTGLVGFLLALSTLNMPKADAAAEPAVPKTIEARLSALTEALRQKEAQLDTVPPETLPSAIEDVINLARVSWGNGGGGAWRNGGFNNGGFRNGGWYNGGFRNGGFRNGGFRNGGFRNGGFRNGGWRDGGGFVNVRL
jgi:rSAM-associated Gly-rich repeat protein